jgi:A/G-specific adenine glycosylase
MLTVKKGLVLHLGVSGLYLAGVTPHQRKTAAIVSRLLEWYPKHARDLPWRRTNDPYCVYVSEVMLQQTQVKTVIPYWMRWMRALPTVQALARAKPEKLHKLWEGLGYYTRVRNMRKAAQVVCKQHGGQFPSRFDDVLALPGIGRYTAGAICSIAFDQPKPILDGNVIRVLTRLYGIGGDPRAKRVNARLWGLAEQLVREAAEARSEGRDPRAEGNPKSEIRNPMSRPSLQKPHARSQQLAHDSPHHASRFTPHASIFNQSLMELGALICTPRQPQCGACPAADHCLALKKGRTAELPRLMRRPRATPRRFLAFAAQQDGRVLVRQRPAGVVNAHLWEFPNVEVETGDADVRNAARRALGVVPKSIEPLCRIKHSITRYRITLEVFRVGLGRKPRSAELQLCVTQRTDTIRAGALRSAPERLDREAPDAHTRWLTPPQLNRLPFASAHKRVLQRVLEAVHSSRSLLK